MTKLMIRTNKGNVEGFMEDGIRRWYGIPYAKPPVGDLRFRRAQEADPWEGVKTCRNWGNRPYQFAPAELLSTMGFSEAPGTSEDCLTVNVFAPEEVEKAPVLLWLYGGANHMGEASLLQFHLDSFAKKGIVGVTVNYRVGPLGFYNFSHLDGSFETNCGISDLLMALRWIRENIAAFGGDPENVTVGGQSAGGTMVAALLASPQAKGLFKKAIPMSGLWPNITTKKTAELSAKIFLDKLGVEEREIAKLRDMPAEELVPGGIEIYTNTVSYYPGLLFAGPVLDDLVPEHPWKALEHGSAKGVSLLIGTTRDDGSIFPASNLSVPRNWDEVRAMLANNGREDLLDKFRQFYGEMEEPAAMMQIATDMAFRVRAIDGALAQSRENQVYMYRFDYATPENIEGGTGANHSSEVNGALDTMLYENCKTFVMSAYVSGSYEDNTPADVRKVRDRVYAQMHDAFVSFVKKGSPNAESLSGTWEPYESTRRATYIFDEEDRLLFDPDRANHDFWEGLFLYE